MNVIAQTHDTMPYNYDTDPRSLGNVIFLICSILLFLGAIGIFIWLLVDAAEEHLVKNILYGTAFLTITLGVLIYSLCVYKSPRTSTTVMWVSMLLGIAAFIVGLALKDPRTQDSPASSTFEIPEYSPASQQDIDIL